ncbi:zinc-dependent metalloprotease [Streptomyces tauricus]|uniref:Zinc-dependent metalloprotease n=1 Tax=Streptomyces tauricus TaxID=68274 RepID=A0ABZ1JBP0_9ACTN|nr:zinc-dependent metalloprotease [Streptomyces tauricus]
MTVFEVVDETRRHAELRDRIREILHTVAPHAADTTGLPLPAQVRYRLLTPKAWREETRLNTQHILARDIADLDLTPPEIKATRAVIKVAGVGPTLVWPLVLGSTQRAADGQRETIITPKALRHAGLLADDPALHQMVAHELVHHLQAEARSGAVWKTFFPGKRDLGNIPRESFTLVLEGHATWADRQVTRHLFGTPADHRLARKSWRYQLHRSIPGIHHLGPDPEAYERGAALIERLMESHGTHGINRIWKDASLLPTTKEIADPDAWGHRLNQDHGPHTVPTVS